VFAKPLVKHTIFKNKYKSLKLQEVAKALLGRGKLENECGSAISRMTVDQRKAYCMHDAHLVAELVRINDGNILRIMEIIANHTGLKLEEVCEKGMTGIWTKIINETVFRKVDLVGYDCVPLTLRRLYSKSHKYPYSDYKQIEEDVEYLEEEVDEYVDSEENSYNDNVSDRAEVSNTYQDCYFKEKYRQAAKDFQRLTDLKLKDHKTLEENSYAISQQKRELENLNIEKSRVEHIIDSIQLNNETCIRIRQMVKEEIESIVSNPRRLLRLALASLFESSRKRPGRLQALYYNRPSHLSVEQTLSQSFISENVDQYRYSGKGDVEGEVEVEVDVAVTVAATRTRSIALSLNAQSSAPDVVAVVGVMVPDELTQLQIV
jgi:hypothetical protein